MAQPSDDLVRKAKAVLRTLRDDRDSPHAPLLESIGAFVRPGSGSEWLDDESDDTLSLVFTSDEGGWLDESDDARFWALVEGVDTGVEGWRAPPALVDLLRELVDLWQADTEPAAAHTGAEADEPAWQRFVSVEPVPGPDWLGWWQGFDQVDQMWKYVESGDTTPTDESPGWTTAPVPTPAGGERETVAGAARTDGITDPEATEDRAELDDVEQVLAEAVAAAIQDVRALGVSEEELSDEEIIEAFQEEITSELALG